MEGPDPVLMRVHSECLTDARHCVVTVVHNLMLPCRPLLRIGWAVCCTFVKKAGIGLHAKSRPITCKTKVLIRSMQTLGHPADGRNYKIAATMLNDLEIKEVALLTNNPDKVKQLLRTWHRRCKKSSIGCGCWQTICNTCSSKVKRTSHHRFREVGVNGAVAGN